VYFSLVSILFDRWHNVRH